MNLFYYCILIGMVIFLTACVDSKQDIENYVNDVKKNAAGAVEPLPSNRQFSSIEYTAGDLRNPFVPASKKTEVVHLETNNNTTAKNTAITQGPRPDASRPREYLEQFPLDAMSMVGTLSKPNMNWGLVKDANGMIHAVKVGDYVGENSGRIVAITPDQIRVIETVPNGSGGWKQARAILPLVKSDAAPEAPSSKDQNSGTAAAAASTTPSPTPTTAPGVVVPKNGSDTGSIGGLKGGKLNTGGSNGY